jgi:hypothetical protein
VFSKIFSNINNHYSFYNPNLKYNSEIQKANVIVNKLYKKNMDKKEEVIDT